MMSVVRILFLMAYIACLVLLCSRPVLSGTVVCPVCGETWDDSVDECPNDGTDLRLVGKEKGDDETENEETSSEPSDNGEAERAEAPNSESEATEPLYFKRHDEGGERQIAPSKANGGYSDRQSRLPGDTRLGGGSKQKKTLSKSVAQTSKKEDDSAMSAAFERRRKSVFDSRERVRLAESHSRLDRAEARRKLLASLGAPLTSLGWRVFWMGEEERPGPVGAAEIDVNVVRYRIRAGISTLVGIRALEVRDELVFLESLSFGVQWPNRFSPFAVVKGGIGILATNRFGVDQAYLLTALGAEAGVDSWINPWLAVTPMFGYMRCAVNDVYWNTFTLKVSIGF